MSTFYQTPRPRKESRGCLSEEAWVERHQARFTWNALEFGLKQYWRTGPGSGREQSKLSSDQIDDQMRELGELVTDPESGTEWHIVHAPMDLSFEVGDNRKSAKLDLTGETCEAVQRLLDDRIERITKDRDMSGPILSIKFSGVQCATPITVPPKSRVSFEADSANFQGGVTFFGVIFGSDSAFPNTLFGDNSSFESSRFLRPLDPEDSDVCKFGHSRFGKNCKFDGASFHGSVDYTYATMGDEFSFKNVSVSGVAQFVRCIFTGTSEFERSFFQCSLEVNDCAFELDLFFSEVVVLDEASFQKSDFGGEAHFYSVRLPRNSDFSDSRFLSGLSISGESSIDGGVFLDGAKFERTSFFEKALFDAELIGHISLRNSIWHTLPRFQNTDFGRGTTFENANFVCIERRRWKQKPVLQYVGRRLAIARNLPRSLLNNGGQPSSEPASWFITDRSEHCFRHVGFPSRERYLGDVNFSAQKWYAIVHKVPPFDSGFRRLLLSIIFLRDRHRIDEPCSRRDLSEFYSEGETVFRDLKRAMQNASAKADEFRFSRLELICHKRRRDHGVSWSEKFFSACYETLSDYGESILLPILALVGLILISSGAYWGLAQDNWRQIGSKLPHNAQTYQIDPELTQAFSFSVSQVARPFSVYPEEALDAGNSESDGKQDAKSVQTKVRDRSRLQFVDRLLSGQPFWVRIIATIESLMSIILFFIFFLAMRRKLQV